MLQVKTEREIVRPLSSAISKRQTRVSKKYKISWPSSLWSRLVITNILVLAVVMVFTGLFVYFVAVARFTAELPSSAITGLIPILLIALGLGFLLALISVYGLSFWLTRRELQSLHSLSHLLNGLNTRQFDLRFSSATSVSTEVKMLGDAFNLMTARLEASFRLQQEFVADVSHELRTPLTSLQGQLEVSLMNPHLDSETRQDLNQLNSELRRLSRLVTNLLTNARAETGLVPNLTVGNLRPVELDAILVEVAHQSTFLHRPVSLEIGCLEQVSVLGDGDMLKQVFLNLVDNALVYTPVGGVVTLSVEITQNASNQSWAVFKVQDTGVGIDSRDLPYLFERHYRARHSTNTKNKAGSGLGLYISNMLVQAHGGHIAVESQLEQGSCFSVWLPIAAN